MFRHPSICCQHLHVVDFIWWCVHMWVNTPDFIYKCVCAKLQMCVRVYTSPLECEQSYLWFSVYQDLYFLHIALCAAKTEALQGHRDASLFITPFNKTWISTACASRRHSRLFAKMGLANFFPECFGMMPRDCQPSTAFLPYYHGDKMSNKW